MQNSFHQPLFENFDGNDFKFGSTKYISRSLLAQNSITTYFDENCEEDDDGVSKKLLAKRTDTVCGIVAVCLQNFERNLQLLGLDLSSHHFSWTDMRDLPSTGQSSISIKAGFFLRQHLFNVLKSESKVFSDPSPKELLKGINDVMKTLSKTRRTLFMLIGQGLPEYLNGETGSMNLWSSNDDFETNLSFKELISSFKHPSCFIIDADYAGLMYNDFVDTTIGNIDRYGFFSCESHEQLPHRVGLPADLFTSCMLTPALVSVLFGSRQFYAFKKGGLHELSLDDFSEAYSNLSLLNPFSFVITKLINVLVKAMAADTMDPLSLYNIFYRDRKIGHFYVNFCLAKRIGNEIGFHPMSYPTIPDFVGHKLWEYLDLYIDRVLLYLIPNNEFGKSPPQEIVSHDMTKFLTEGLIAIEHEFTQQIMDNVPNEIALLPMILEDNTLVERGLIALTQYIDTGEQALYKCICLNIIDSLININLNMKPELAVRVAYCTAKLMCFLYRKEEGLTLFSSSPNQIVQNLLAQNKQPNSLPDVLALILSCIGMAVDHQTEVNLLSVNVFGTILSFTQSQNMLLQYWALLYISLLLKSDMISVQTIRIAEVLIPVISNTNVDIKAAAISAFSSLIEYTVMVSDCEEDDDEEEIELKEIINKCFVNILQNNKESPSQIIRMQVLFLIQCYLTSFVKKGEKINDLIIDSLETLSTDPHPEICSVAKSILDQAKENKEIQKTSKIPALINGSFDAFLSSVFNKLENYMYPPFTIPPTRESSLLIKPIPTNRIGGFVFSEVDHFDTDLNITTNVLFIGGEKIVYGDSSNTVCIRNYSEHSLELRHRPEVLFNNINKSVPLTTMFSLTGTFLILGTKNGNFSVISNALCSSPILSDSFRINNVSNLNSSNSYYDWYTHRLFIGTDSGSIECWDSFSCQRTPSIPVFQNEIKKLHTIKWNPDLVGVSSDRLKLIDMRDPRSQIYEINTQENIIDFNTLPYQNNDVIISTTNGVSKFDIRSPEKCIKICHDRYYENLCSCLWAPVIMGWGSSLDFFDIRSGSSVSVLSSIFTKRNKPAVIQTASIHEKNQSFAFVAKDKSLHVGSVIIEGEF